MLRPWAQWLVNHNLKIVLYIIWLIILPLFWFVYLGPAMQDAKESFDDLKSAKKGNK